MSYIPTTATDIVKQPQFTEETVDGTLPLAVATGTHFVSCGFVESLGEDIKEANNQIRPLGSFDVQKKIQLGEEISSSIVFQPSDFKLMKRGILTPVAPSATPANPTMVAPNGTNGVSISIVFTALINGVEKWKAYTGLRFDGCSGTIERESGFKVTMPFHCKNVTDWTATTNIYTSSRLRSSTFINSVVWHYIRSRPSRYKRRKIRYNSIQIRC